MSEQTSTPQPDSHQAVLHARARRVFVSYTVEDRARAAHVVRALRDAGMQTFWDQDLQPRSDFRVSLEDQIRKSDVTLVLWSRVSVRSHFVAEEAQLAKKLGRYLPVLLERVKPPLGLASDQFAWLDVWTGDLESPLWKAVLRAIHDPSAGSRSKATALVGFRDRPDMPLLLPLTLTHCAPEVHELAVSADLVTRSDFDLWLRREQPSDGDRDYLHIGPFAAYCRGSHVEAEAYCHWLSAESGHIYRMPTWMEFRVLARAFSELAAADCSPGVLASPRETVAELLHLCGALWTWLAHDEFDAAEPAAAPPLAQAAGGCWCTSVSPGSVPLARFPTQARLPFVGLRLVREQ